MSKTRPKILHLIEGLGSGGAERLLHTNLSHFDHAATEHEVVTVFSAANHWREPIERLGVPVSTLECGSIRDVLKGVARLRSHLRESRPDLIHTHLWAANIIGRIAGKLEKIPVVSSIHNPDYEPEAISDGSEVGGFKKRIIRGLDAWTAHRGCARMIAVSEYVRDSTVRRIGFPADRIDVLYNPIAVDEMQPAAKSSGFWEQYGLPSGAKVLLNVARISPQKGLVYAIRAMRAVRDQFPDAHLVSVGATDDTPWLERLKSEATEAGVEDAVHFLGARRDVPSFLRNCDIFVFPSLHEGLGIALIEAMAVGCAVIASSTGPIPEFVTDERNGRLVPARDPERLSAAINLVLQDDTERAALGEQARTTALEMFQPQPAADRLTGIYLKLIGAGADRATDA